MFMDHSLGSHSIHGCLLVGYWLYLWYIMFIDIAFAKPNSASVSIELIHQPV